MPRWLLRHGAGAGNLLRWAEPCHPISCPRLYEPGPLGLVFLVKYGPGISHNLCTKVRRQLDEICSVAGSWDALSAGMMELSPGRQRLTRGKERQ